MGIGDIRYTVIQVINEVQRKMGLDATNTISANKQSVLMLDFVNDVCNDLSDFGNWQEALVTSNVTCVSGQRDYSINTSANIKNIGDIYFSLRRGPIRNITIDDMRIMSRVSSKGTPTQFTVFGTDANGNPALRFRPTPSATEAGGIFSVLYYVRAPLFTTSDINTLIPFPGDVVTDGVEAMAILNESEGAPNDRYKYTQQKYLEGRKNALNRFNGDTGWNVSFTPSMTGRRRR